MMTNLDPGEGLKIYQERMKIEQAFKVLKSLLSIDKLMRLLNVDVSYALSPQAKSKVERSYRWLQDRVVTTCIYEEVSEFEDCRGVLRDIISRYNAHQVHSTTGEIPNNRFERALKSGNSLFSKFSLPKPYTSPLDVFCLREQRMVNGYRRISLFKYDIELPE
jgi:hypothetical protein